MPSIMVDGYNLSLETGTGVATYGRNLCLAAKELDYDVNVLYGGRSTRSRNPLLREVAFFDARKLPEKSFVSQPGVYVDAFMARFNCSVDEVPISGRVIYDSLRARLPVFDRLYNSTDLYHRALRSFRWFGAFAQVSVPDTKIAHWTYPLPIRARGSANIYTIHDLVPLRLPHTTLDHKRRYFSLCKRIADTADHIITVSETSKQDIIELLGADPERVTNTFQSVTVPEECLSKSDAQVGDELQGIFNLKHKGYFLFFGAVEPKKNLNRLLEAYLVSGLTTPLVIVGAPGWKSDEELRLLKTVTALPGHMRERVIRLEYLPRQLLFSLIRGAKVTLFPSLYEGFGLPVLESMICGTAVITANVGSLREVAGDAACFVDPYSTRSIAEAMKALDANDSLRLKLEDLGREQARNFSPENYARRVGEVYRTVIPR
jgi:glycosyltransferase involved in cell wall biosynthesis